MLTNERVYAMKRDNCSIAMKKTTHSKDIQLGKRIFEVWMTITGQQKRENVQENILHSVVQIFICFLHFHSGENVLYISFI